MRVDQAPFTDVRVRQAFRLMVDRNQMVRQVYSGHGRIGNDMYCPYDPSYPSKLAQRHQDIDQAKSLLKAAGQSDMAITLTTSPEDPGLLESAQVFAQNAKSLTEWIEDLRKEREDRQFLAALALWFSRVDGRDRLLQRLSEGGSPRLTKYVQELRADTAPDLTTLDARSPVELDMLWASFFATGDDRYVLRVIRALSAAPQDKSPAIVAAAARWSLTANARQHSAVLDVCRKEMPRQPEAVAAVLRDVVAKAESDRTTRKTP